MAQRKKAGSDSFVGYVSAKFVLKTFGERGWKEGSGLGSLVQF